ncbi:MAG: S1 RNA-binding domain-containing protein [Ruminococcus sp.]|nr:S1 RNA-binding domain-containing protein [Ruminococcus sp.]
MQLEIGKIYNGTVKGITQYGAFVDIEGGGSGMVHISEIANVYVSEIRDFLTEGQEVRVKVIGVNEAGKVSLSLKKAQAEEGGDPYQNGSKNRAGGGQGKPKRNAQRSKPNIYEPKKSIPQSEMSFEDMISHFKQTSEERIGDGKRRTDRKNGTKRK